MSPDRLLTRSASGRRVEPNANTCREAAAYCGRSRTARQPCQRRCHISWTLVSWTIAANHASSDATEASQLAVISERWRGLACRGTANAGLEGDAQKIVAHKTPPAGPMGAQAAKGNAVPLINERPKPIRLRTAALSLFRPRRLPPASRSLRTRIFRRRLPCSELGRRAGDASYAIIMEDSESKPTSLFRALAGPEYPSNVDQPAGGTAGATQPHGTGRVLPGRNSSGTHGYFGPSRHWANGRTITISNAGWIRCSICHHH